MVVDTIRSVSGERLPLVLDVMRAVSSSLDLDTLLPTIMQRTTELVHADRSTFFIVDAERRELWSRLAQGLGTEIRVPIGVGIAGHVAETGQLVNIPDAYADPRFNSEVDRRTGYHTRNILCVPVADPDGRIVGVVQAINHDDGPFGPEDEAVLLALAAQIDVALRNARLVEQVRRQSQTNRVLLEVMRAVSAELELDNLLPLIVNKTSEAMNAERSTIFLVDERRGQLWSRVAQGLGEGLAEIRFPIGVGIAGHVGRSGEVVNIPDAYADPRFNPEVDRRTGYRTRNILCMPIYNDRGVIIGVVQVLNKIGGPFTYEDEALLGALASQVSVALENAQLFEETVYLKNYNESILASMATGVVTLDRDGNISTYNPAAARIFRLAADVTGQAVSAVIAHEDDPASAMVFAGVQESARAGLRNTALLDKVRETLVTGEAYYGQDLKILLHDGHVISINASAHPLRNSKGATIGAVIVIQDITDEQRLMSTLSRYVSPAVAEELLRSEAKNKLGGDHQTVTILCSDIRGFTALSEGKDPKDIVSLLNEYFRHMIEAIQSEGGTIDKYIGDAILAVFGAPIEQPDHAVRAVRAAIKMRAALAQFNEKQQIMRGVQIENGIGLSAGLVLVGNIGSDQRMDYTAIGDAVNVAARIEGLTKEYTTKIIVSSSVHDEVEKAVRRGLLDANAFAFEDLKLNLVRGRQEAINLYGIPDP